VPLKSKKKTLTPKQKKLHNFSFGSQGETQAVSFLVHQGYQILATNFAVKNKEVDIIAFDPRYQEVVFVEVKSRETGFYGDPSYAVDKHKLANLYYVAKVFLNQSQLNFDYRFDIITIVDSKITHYENVTWGR